MIVSSSSDSSLISCLHRIECNRAVRFHSLIVFWSDILHFHHSSLDFAPLPLVSTRCSWSFSLTRFPSSMFRSLLFQKLLERFYRSGINCFLIYDSSSPFHYISRVTTQWPPPPCSSVTPCFRNQTSDPIFLAAFGGRKFFTFLSSK